MDDLRTGFEPDGLRPGLTACQRNEDRTYLGTEGGRAMPLPQRPLNVSQLLQIDDR